MKKYLPLSRNHQKWITRLHRKKHRNEERIFIAEGVHSLKEAVSVNSYPLKEIVVEKGVSESLQSILPDGVPIYECSEKAMRVISTEENPQGVLVLCHKKDPVLEDLPEHFCDVMLYLDRIADPGNLGTIIRTAAWFDIGVIILSPRCVDPLSTKVIRASVGSIFRIVIFQSIEPESLVQFAQRNGYKLIATVPKGGIPVHRWKRSGKDILLLGQESVGLSNDIKKCADENISIGGKGNVQSLNLAVATAIILYEISKM
jgi:TrmH family RNA methyltransferase